MSWIERIKLENENRFLEMCHKQNDKYKIPKELKEAEYPFLQKDRNKIYKRQNQKYTNEFGKIMEQIYQYMNDEYYIGIHRTCNDADNMMYEGIKMKSNINDITNHVQIIKNFPLLLEELQNADNYKGATTSLIIKIPKKDIDIHIESDDREPIYYEKDGNLYLNPKFIIGHVPVNDGNLNQFIFNDNIDPTISQYPTFYDEAIKDDLNKKRR